ncbi:hypothetical protein [Sphingobium subterraneum]|nr:hypothetical protein [Sphingobium subterraneum]
MMREFAQVREPVGLDDLIEALTQLRAALPEGAEADVRFKGDDVFGRQICISWLREQTAEEAELDARYTAASATSLSLAA